MTDTPPSPRRRQRQQLSPAQRALALLVRREHSRPELLRKLVARGIASADAEAAVDRMTDAGWQDDGRFAVALARMRAASGHGPVWIEAELSTHGLGADRIEAAFRALDDDGGADWRASALALLQRRFRADVLATDPGARRKAGDFLLRRGFAGDTLREAIRDFCGR
ncbi:recombination regulator RecX [Luteimonas sp. BDR2-5]|uniref:regulatory protein RecX n=1 Tax=Proluteimonas luteida TaxID=2878685 RepID=UPI001E47BF8F|nr:recombination regulator RecX [Luteimonas sp. BDR2-5]